jgi:general secretion pathway protein G
VITLVQGVHSRRRGAVVLLAVVVTLTSSSCRRYYDHSRPKAPIDITSIMQSLVEYAINNNGSYPHSLEPLVTPDVNGQCYLEGYNGAVPTDPWKRAYHYEPPTPAYPRPHVWSYGADGRLGGTGDDADIDSEELRDSDR